MNTGSKRERFGAWILDDLPVVQATLAEFVGDLGTERERVGRPSLRRIGKFHGDAGLINTDDPPFGTASEAVLRKGVDLTVDLVVVLFTGKVAVADLWEEQRVSGIHLVWVTIDDFL